jgi:hypothetical protein
MTLPQDEEQNQTNPNNACDMITDQIKELKIRIECFQTHLANCERCKEKCVQQQKAAKRPSEQTRQQVAAKLTTRFHIYIYWVLGWLATAISCGVLAVNWVTNANLAWLPIVATAIFVFGALGFAIGLHEIYAELKKLM